MINVIKLSELKNKMTQNYELFICSCSFEERCLSIAQNFNLNNIEHVFMLYNVDFIDYITENKNKLISIFSMKHTPIEIKQSDPLFSTDVIIRAISQKINERKKLSVLLDITTLTHEILLIIINILLTLFPHVDITCIYNNAAEYDSENQKDKKWLSKGVKEIRSVLGYLGNIIPTRKTHMIVLVGYEYERATNIIQIIEPNSIALGYGRSDDATTDKDKDANEHYSKLVQDMAISYSEIDSFEIKCKDPFATSEKLSEQIKKAGDKNIIIVPLNNKISTIGVALTAIKNNDIQVCYAPALIYNYENYSKPGNDCYIFNISQNLKTDD
jgi:hypothetical protein